MDLKELENVKVDKDLKVLRREVWYVNPVGTIGSEQSGQRPAIIVSNDIGNKNSSTVEVVYVTTSQIKAFLPTHVRVNNFKLTGIALCESVTTVDKSRLVDRITMLTEQQMALIEKGMCISLDITKKSETRPYVPSTLLPTVTVLAIPGEDNNYIIRQANEHIKKIVETGNSLSSIESELAKIMQANITFDGISADYLTEDLKEEIRSKAAEKIRYRKNTLEHVLLSLMSTQQFAKAKEPMEEVKLVEVKKTASKHTFQKAEDNLDFEEVKRLYLEEGYTIAKLCQKFKRSSVTMGAYLKEHGITKPAGRQKKPR